MDVHGYLMRFFLRKEGYLLMYGVLVVSFIIRRSYLSFVRSPSLSSTVTVIHGLVRLSDGHCKLSTPPGVKNLQHTLTLISSVSNPCDTLTI